MLLYELLTGSPPLDRERLKAIAWDEICRVIREEEPPRPSTRLATSTLTGRFGVASKYRKVSGRSKWPAVWYIGDDSNSRELERLGPLFGSS